MSRNLSCLLIIALQLLSKSSLSQYAPQVGIIGTTAIHADSSIIRFWASGVSKYQLGYQNISDTSLGYVAVGLAEFGTGKADHMTFSLGDAGSIELTFDHEIYNGAGPDFVVFENGFSFGKDSNFLELAFVEVADSSGRFFRFPAYSLTDTLNQIGPFGSLNASKLHNLAGKYLGNYGTPFDLEDLKDLQGLDLSHIRKIKIIDAIGSLQNDYGSKDVNGRLINDPWPTPFASGGFDLDAVGIIHGDLNSSGIQEVNENALQEYPNPVRSNGIISIESKMQLAYYSLTDLYGNEIQRNVCSANLNQFELIAPAQCGIYFLEVGFGGKSFIKKIVVQPSN